MTVPDELLPQYDLDYRKGRPNRYAGQIDWSQDVVLVDDEAGLDAGSTTTLDDRDEYPEVTQADLDRATFRIGLKNLFPVHLMAGKAPAATIECRCGEPSTKDGA